MWLPTSALGLRLSHDALRQDRMATARLYGAFVRLWEPRWAQEGDWTAGGNVLAVCRSEVEARWKPEASLPAARRACFACAERKARQRPYR